jgi:hypothetical protein
MHTPFARVPLADTPSTNTPFVCLSACSKFTVNKRRVPLPRGPKQKGCRLPSCAAVHHCDDSCVPSPPTHAASFLLLRSSSFLPPWLLSLVFPLLSTWLAGAVQVRGALNRRRPVRC